MTQVGQNDWNPASRSAARMPRQLRRRLDPCVEDLHAIGPTGAVWVIVATRPVDFRKGTEGLATLTRENIQADPFSGAAYVRQRASRVIY